MKAHTVKLLTNTHFKRVRQRYVDHRPTGGPLQCRSSEGRGEVRVGTGSGGMLQAVRWRTYKNKQEAVVTRRVMMQSRGPEELFPPRTQPLHNCLPHVS